MHFKTLEIQGFKSFADKTVLDFDTKMTAVVGSNGNGKSNISDALRWVMGEQGAKTLRGDKMEDVIFHGTVTRKQMGFAKVALSIDNTDRALSLDSDEVVIARKLYRTGESEYLINGEKSRLKDIQELLMGTGLGREGYSIIGQGRVAEIVNAKGSQRREIFEEAAGVSKFLHKKAEAERELARAQDNFLRLKDIETSLSERLPVLEKQSEKAKKARELLEKEKSIEISVTAAELEKLKKDLDETENKILLNQGECDQFDREISELGEENERLTIKKSQFSAQLSDLRRSSDSAKDEIAESEKQTAVLENDIKHCGERIAEIKKLIEESKRSAGEFDKQAAAIDAEKAGLLKKRSETDAKISELRAELEKQSEGDKKLGDEYDALDRENSEAYTKLTEARITLRQAEKTKEELSERMTSDTLRVEDAEKAADGYRQRRRELSIEAEKLGEELSELENKLGGYRKLYQGKSDKLAESRDRHETLKSEQNRRKQRLEFLSDVEKSMSGYFTSVKNIMKAKNGGLISGIHGTVADVISTDKRYVVAIETALGNALQNIIVDNEDTAIRCMRYLKDTKGGRATFYPITSVKGTVIDQPGLSSEEGFEGLGSRLVTHAPEYEGIIRSVLGRTAVFEDINSAKLVAKKYGYKFRIITLDGQIINAGGSYTGGETKETNGIISRKQEIDGLKLSIAEAESRINAEGAQLSALSAETAKMKIEMEGFSERINAVKQELTRVEAETGGVKDLIRQCEEQAENAELVIDTGRKRIAEQEALITSSNGEIETLTKSIATAEERLKLANERLSLANERRKQAADRITELDMTRLSVTKDIESLDMRMEQLKASREAAEGSSERLIAEENEKKAEIADLGKKRDEAKLAAQRAGERYGKNSAAISEIMNKSDECERRINELNKEMREKADDKTKFSNALAVAKEKKDSIQRDTEKLKNSLWDKYEIAPSEAKTMAVKIDDLSAAQRELQDIHRKISSLGNVNYAAIEEYEEVRVKYGELSQQLSDVEKARDDLEKLITDLTADIKSRFLSSFNDINTKFSAIFTQVFGGGQAHLELMDPENVLESGIEIFAAPPGKLIKNLISLSGGEQTMVAITIYFAILQHRPTPFCMLDEVDAALDEINVVKYVTYLKRFCSRTQLMVISHRRGTIEGCDVLYGVFMQEKGVSRLIHQELSDIEDADLD